MENSVNRNKVAHTHEVVYTLLHWMDDDIFERYPTWEDCVEGGVFSTPQLEAFFGKVGNQYQEVETAGGPTNYRQCVKTGIGRQVVANMLESAETPDAIRHGEQVVKQARAFFGSWLK